MMLIYKMLAGLLILGFLLLMDKITENYLRLENKFAAKY